MQSLQMASLGAPAPPEAAAAPDGNDFFTSITQFATRVGQDGQYAVTRAAASDGFARDAPGTPRRGRRGPGPGARTKGDTREPLPRATRFRDPAARVAEDAPPSAEPGKAPSA